MAQWYENVPPFWKAKENWPPGGTDPEFHAVPSSDVEV
jgi:hypothetical protein